MVYNIKIQYNEQMMICHYTSRYRAAVVATTRYAISIADIFSLAINRGKRHSVRYGYCPPQ